MMMIRADVDGALPTRENAAPLLSEEKEKRKKEKRALPSQIRLVKILQIWRT